MPTKKLTHTVCEGLKLKDGKRNEEWDTMVPGLHLRINLDGGKVWHLRFRLTNGMQRRFKLGLYPALPLADARKVALAALDVVAKGGDPSADARREAMEAKAQPVKTVDDLMTAYFAAVRAGDWRPRGKVKAESTIRGDEGVYRRHMQKAIGREFVTVLDARMIKNMLRGIKAKAGLQCNKAWSCGSQAFSYAAKELQLVQVNPFSIVNKLMADPVRDRLLSDGEVRAAVLAVRDPSALRLGAGTGERVYIGELTAMALELTFRLGQRRCEVAGMERGELRLDEGVWIIRRERTKSKMHQHLVPLPPGAVALIRRAMAETDAMRRRQGKGPSAYVFGSVRTMKAKPAPGVAAVDDKPLGGSALTHALGDAYKALGVDDATLHDWRTCMTTNLTGGRCGDHGRLVVGKLLSHSAQEGARVTGIYDVNEYRSQKLAALVAWEGLFESIVGGPAVVKLAA